MHAPEALLLDLLEWLAAKPRRYDEVMAAWRTNCPRLPVWEDAVDFGLVERCAGEDGATFVRLTAAGEARLGARRAAPQSPSALTP
jgi:D-3-phosphoglycerate dehydrogenase